MLIIRTRLRIMYIRKFLRYGRFSPIQSNNNAVHLTVTVGMNLSRYVLPNTRAHVMSITYIKLLFYYHRRCRHYPTEQITHFDNN